MIARLEKSHFTNTDILVNDKSDLYFNVLVGRIHL